MRKKNRSKRNKTGNNTPLKEKKKRLSREEELEWIRKIRHNILKGK